MSSATAVVAAAATLGQRKRRKRNDGSGASGLGAAEGDDRGVATDDGSGSTQSAADEAGAVKAPERDSPDYICDRCGEDLLTARALESHRLAPDCLAAPAFLPPRGAEGEFPFDCPGCTRMFATAAGRSKHARTHQAHTHQRNDSAATGAAGAESTAANMEPDSRDSEEPDSLDGEASFLPEPTSPAEEANRLKCPTCEREFSRVDTQKKHVERGKCRPKSRPSDIGGKDGPEPEGAQGCDAEEGPEPEFAHGDDDGADDADTADDADDAADVSGSSDESDNDAGEEDGRDVSDGRATYMRWNHVVVENGLVLGEALFAAATNNDTAPEVKSLKVHHDHTK